jgi:peptide/nickel transport system permease protein
MVGMVLCTAFVLLAIMAPLFAPYDPLATDWDALRQPPSSSYWFGTDDSAAMCYHVSSGDRAPH